MKKIRAQAVGSGPPTEPRGQIALEVDGPTHFCTGSEEPNPHTALKRWLLSREGPRPRPRPRGNAGAPRAGRRRAGAAHAGARGAAGYRVVSVPYFDWSTLQSDAVRRAYVTHRLTEIGWDMQRQCLSEDAAPVRSLPL